MSIPWIVFLGAESCQTIGFLVEWIARMSSNMTKFDVHVRILQQGFVQFHEVSLVCQRFTIDPSESVSTPTSQSLLHRNAQKIRVRYDTQCINVSIATISDSTCCALYLAGIVRCTTFHRSAHIPLHQMNERREKKQTENSCKCWSHTCFFGILIFFFGILILEYENRLNQNENRHYFLRCFERFAK